MTIRRISIAILAAAGVVLAGLLLLARRPVIAPIGRSVPESFSAASVTQGEALAAAGHCASCHTGADGQPFAGGYRMNTPFGIIYGSNLTPDPKTGIGLWSLQAFARAMREGVSRDGSHLFPAFPYYAFTKLSDDDIEALYAYLMTLPAGERREAGKHTSVSSQRPRLPGGVEDPVFQKRTVPRPIRQRATNGIAEDTWRRPCGLLRLSHAAQCSRCGKDTRTLTPAPRSTGGSRLR